MAASRPRRASPGREPRPVRTNTAADLLAARRLLGRVASNEELNELKAAGALDAPFRTNRHRTAPSRLRGGPHLQGTLPLSDSPPAAAGGGGDPDPGTGSGPLSGTSLAGGGGSPPMVPPSSNSPGAWATFLRDVFGMRSAEPTVHKYGVAALKRVVADYADVEDEEDEIDNPAGLLIYLLRQDAQAHRGEAAHG